MIIYLNEYLLSFLDAFSLTVLTIISQMSLGINSLLVFRDLAACQDSVLTPRIKVYCMVLTMVNCEEKKQHLKEKQQGTGSKHTREMNYKLFCWRWLSFRIDIVKSNPMYDCKHVTMGVSIHKRDMCMIVCLVSTGSRCMWTLTCKHVFVDKKCILTKVYFKLNKCSERH